MIWQRRLELGARPASWKGWHLSRDPGGVGHRVCKLLAGGIKGRGCTEWREWSRRWGVTRGRRQVGPTLRNLGYQLRVQTSSLWGGGSGGRVHPRNHELE